MDHRIFVAGLDKESQAVALGVKSGTKTRKLVPCALSRLMLVVARGSARVDQRQQCAGLDGGGR
jgi:hypothetical protein